MTYYRADLLKLNLPGARRSALSIPQLAARIYGVPVGTVTDQDVNRERRTAIRNVQHAIQELRLRGVPVCSGDEGLWRAATSQEALECADRLRRRYITQAYGARALRRAGRAMARAEANIEP